MLSVPESYRDRLDAIAWKTIHEQGSRSEPPPGLAASGRPANFAEFAELAARWDEELAWSEFLHEFFHYKQASFLAVPPPKTLRLECRALLAGVAEFLSEEFNLPVPEWVNEPEYFLQEMWDPWEDICPDMEPFRQERIARSHPAFLRRGVVYEARNLITL